MKVLHFFKCYLPDSIGGIEQVIFQLAESGNKVGVNSGVLSLSKKKCYLNKPFYNHTIHTAKQDLYIASTGLSLSVFKIFKELAAQADIIHYHFPWPYMDIVHFATKCNKPTILTYHSDIVKQKTLLKLYEPLLHRFMQSVDHIVATSPNYMVTSPVLHQYQSKTSVIPIGLDRSMYPAASSDKKEYWRQNLGEKFFLFVGIIRYYKGLHILIDALSGIDLPVVILGAGPVEKELQKQALELGLKNIHFLGRLPDEDKFALLELSYAIVFPSHLRSEAFGVSLLEGAMYGKPLISSEIGTGTTYINVHQETGLVVPPSDPLALREAMLTLWNDCKQAHIYGQNAKKRFEDLFTSEMMLKKYLDIYKKILNLNSENTDSFKVVN